MSEKKYLRTTSVGSLVIQVKRCIINNLKTLVLAAKYPGGYSDQKGRLIAD
jgi:hypothetical protein